MTTWLPMFTRVYCKHPRIVFSVYKGSQSVLYVRTVVYVYELKGAPRIQVLSCLQFSMVSPNFKHQIPFLCETPIAGLELIYRPMQIILPL